MLRMTIAACVALLATALAPCANATAADLAVKKVATKSTRANPAPQTGLVNKYRYGGEGSVYRPSNSPGGWR